jgi:hypothetical protein
LATTVGASGGYVSLSGAETHVVGQGWGAFPSTRNLDAGALIDAQAAAVGSSRHTLRLRFTKRYKYCRRIEQTVCANFFDGGKK